MKCSHCGRHTNWISTNCRTCQRRMPAWYVVATIAAFAGIYGAFVLLENVF